MNKKERNRLGRLLPNNKPRWVRCYDSGPKYADRYTVVYTGNYRGPANSHRMSIYVAMSGQPTHPQGVCQHGETYHPIDWPTYGHLGKRIKFDQLPEACQKVVLREYKELWGLQGS
jgi:hypothetical protein